MKKGQIVTYRAIAESSYYPMLPYAVLHTGTQTKHDVGGKPDFRAVYRAPLETPQQGIFIGWSKLLHGRGIPAINDSYYNEYEPASFETHGAVKVAVIAPLTGGEAYRKPVQVLPEDLEV